MKSLFTIVLIILSSICLNAQIAWTQIGQDIEGEAAGDNSGYSISISDSGNIVAVGAPKNSEAGIEAGQVRVYEYNGNSWVQLGQDIDGEASDDNSGCSICLNSDGTILAIGAYNNDGNGSNSGHVRVYTFSGGNWIQIGQDIDGKAAGDSSGISLSMNSDGTILAVGAPYNDDNGINAGHVRVYEFLTGNWIQIGQDIDGEIPGELSGSSVNINKDGTMVAIGAPNNNCLGGNTGLTRVFYNNGGAWTQLGQNIMGESTGDLGGTSLSLNADGMTIAIGAPNNDGGGNNAGHVRIFEYDSAAINMIVAIYDSLTFIPDGPSCFPNCYENPVTFSSFAPGDTIQSTSDIASFCINMEHTFAGDLSFRIICPNNQSVVLDSYDNSGGADLGQANINDASPMCDPSTNPPGTGWTYCWSEIYPQLDTLNVLDSGTSPIPATNLSNNTGYLIPENPLSGLVGCPLNGNWSVEICDYWGIDNGYVFWWSLTLFDQQNQGYWTQVGQDIDGELANDYSGKSISLNSNGSVVAIGADGHNYLGTDAGQARVFENINGVWTQVAQDINGEAALDHSGNAVSINADGSVVAIGALFNDGSGIDAGHLKVYECDTATTIQINPFSKFSIFPNPTTGLLTIEGVYINQISIFNINGGVVFEKTIKNDHTKIDLSKCAKGVYFVKITTKDRVVIDKLILE